MELKNIIKHTLLLIFILSGGSALAENVTIETVTIQKGETKELTKDSHIKELIIYGDQNSVGQVKVEAGVVTIDKLTYKYSFTPNIWQNISFPVDMDLSTMSNLISDGINYEARIYSTYKKSSGDDPWIKIQDNKLTALTGYSMKITSASENPVEVTFSLSGIKLDTETSKANLYVSLDMTNATPATEKVMYVKAKNVKSNVLKVNVTYSPTETAMLPFNYAKELSNSRIVNTYDKKGVRLTLPTSEPTKIVILNKKGNKVLKKIMYSAPAEIDLSDLKKRDYQMIINYGSAMEVRTFSLK